jgi:hypothetical protein
MRLSQKYSHGAQLATKYGGHAERLGDKIQTAGKYVGMLHKGYGEKVTQVGEAVSQAGKSVSQIGKVAEQVGGIASATGQIAGQFSKLPTRGYQSSWKTVGAGALGSAIAGPVGGVALSALSRYV